MDFHSFFSDFCAASLSGAVLALLFFLFREWWHPLSNITGQWYFETHTKSTTFPPFEDMHLKYQAMIWQEGPTVHGTTEKIFEHNSKEAFEYDNAKRVHGTLDGYIDRYYLRKNRIAFHLNEEGRVRPSSAIFNLALKKGELAGTFYSTAAGSSGTAIWSRKRHSASFSEVLRHERTISADSVSSGLVPPKAE